MGGGYIELHAGADGRYLLIRASEWSSSIIIRQPGVSRGVGEIALASAMAAALHGGGATAHALWLLAQDMQGFSLPAPGSPRTDQALIEAIGTAVRLRRVLVIRAAQLPGASEIEGDTPSMVRAVSGAVEPVRPVAGQNVANMGSGERWLIVLQKMPSHLSWEGASREARANAEAFFQPETLAMLAASLAVMAMNPAGAMALLAGGLLLGVSLFFAGQAALEGAAQIADVFEDVDKARSAQDLDRAARRLATGVEKIGVEMFIRIICRAGPKKPRGGSQQVQAGGGGGGVTRPPPGQSASPPRERERPRVTRGAPEVRPDVPKEWLKPDGSPDWSKLPKDGFANGKSSPDMLKPAQVVDRYGSDAGKFLSPAGTPYEQRALPWVQNPDALKKYEVLRDLPVESGGIAPGFGHSGGGVQHKTGVSIAELLDGNQPGGPYLKELP